MVVIGDLDSKINSFFSLNQILKNSFEETGHSFLEIKQDSDLNNLPSEVFNHYFFNKKRMASAFENKRKWDSLVASPEEILSDYAAMEKNPLITSWLRENFQLRSIEGHAHEGHVFFNRLENPLVNTQLSDIFSNDVLENITRKSGDLVFTNSSLDSPRKVALNQSQQAINNAVNFALNLINGRNAKDINPNNMFGIKFPFKVSVDNSAFVKGFFFGANFDNYSEIRRPMENEFSIVAGGGSSYMGNIPLIKKLGINLNEFAKGNYNDPLLNFLFNYDSKHGTSYLIDTLESANIIEKFDSIDYKVKSWNEVLEQAQATDETDSRQIFIRARKGLGVSDDIACMVAAFIDYWQNDPKRTYSWYHSLQLGARAADLIDTLTKESSLTVPGGFDTIAGKFLNYNYVENLKSNGFFRKLEGYVSKRALMKDLKQDSDFVLVSKNELIDLTALSLNPNSQNNANLEKHIFHSSGKNFLKQLTFNHVEHLPDGKSKSYQDITSVTEQQIRFVYRKLEKDNDSRSLWYYGSPRTFPGRLYANDILIGFHKEPFSNLIDYMDDFVLPIAKRPSTRRLDIKDFYSNKNVFNAVGHKKDRKQLCVKPNYRNKYPASGTGRR